MQALFFAGYTLRKAAMGHRIRAKKRKHLPFAPIPFLPSCFSTLPATKSLQKTPCEAGGAFSIINFNTLLKCETGCMEKHQYTTRTKP